jgi:hypothetical protein
LDHGEEIGGRVKLAGSKQRSRIRLHGVIHDFEPEWNTCVERPGYRIQSDVAFSQGKVRDYEAVMLIGGRPPELSRDIFACLKLG